MECARERTRSWWRCSQQIAPAAAPAEVGRNLCYVVVLGEPEQCQAVEAKLLLHGGRSA